MGKAEAVVVIHAETDSIGNLADLLPELGITYKVVAVTDNLPEPDELQLLILLGSPASAYDHRLAWVPKELNWLKQVQQKNIPTLGICFGAQILTRALDGQVFRNSQPELGWTDIHIVNDKWQHAGPWFNFHYDGFTAPKDAILLAENDIAQQAYSYGKALAVQFHPEMCNAMFDCWMKEWQSTQGGQRFLEKIADLPEQWRQEIAAREISNRQNFKQLLMAFLKNI